jgi:GNAT superfamily N-acetyltransferase
MNDDNLEIRPLEVTDWEAFKEIRLQAISDSPSAVWPTLDEEAGRTSDEVQARIKMSATQVVFGAFRGNKLEGIAGLRREALAQVAHKAILWGVFVKPDLRKQGIARQLFERILCHARKEGVLQIQLCVNAENAKAKSLYQSLGFKAYGLESRAMRVGDRFYDEEHMVLRLDE